MDLLFAFPAERMVRMAWDMTRLDAARSLAKSARNLAFVRLLAL